MSSISGDLQLQVIVVLTILCAGSTYVLTSLSVRFLKSRGMMVKDYHKLSMPLVPRPAGPALLASIILSELFLYNFVQSPEVLAVTLTTIIAGTIGIIDDYVHLSGAVKPLTLLAASIPILILEAYTPRLTFPFFGSTRLTIVYPLLVLIAIPVTANTVNTLDVLNGVVSRFIAIATIPLLAALILRGSNLVAVAAIPLLASSAAFYLHHKYPSKIFPGDSGTLAFGAMYGSIAIVGGVEIVGVVALLPAILNSFLYLSSVRRFLEHKRVVERPTRLRKDEKLEASSNLNAPITLVRLLLLDGPRTEKEVGASIAKLTVISAFLAILTALATWRL